MTKLSLSHYLQKNNKNLGSLLTKLSQLQHWNNYLRQALGEESAIMDHCHVVNLTANALIVIADSPHWLTRIRFHVADLVPKLRQHQGLEQLKAICCKTQPNINLHHRKKPKKKPLTLKENTAKTLLDVADKIEDKKIRSIMERIASHVDNEDE